MQALSPAVVVPPTRSSSQQREALTKANEVRLYRAHKVKARLAKRTLGLFDALDDPKCGTMKVREVLMAMPGLGETKVDMALHKAQISAAKTCAGITAQQRMRLASTLAERHPLTVIVFRADEGEDAP